MLVTALMEWQISTQPEPYDAAIATMQARARRIREGSADELVWLLEHPPLYTAGSSARVDDLIDAGRFPVHETGRGGQYTYHGPGQRVAYVMMDLKRPKLVESRVQSSEFSESRNSYPGPLPEGEGEVRPDIRAFVKDLEQWLIHTLAQFGVRGEIREGRVGVWVQTPEGEKKIAALGIRLQQWVSTHGIALNVHPDLSHYSGIVPCGISQYGVTSLHDLGVMVSMAEVDAVLRDAFGKVFGG